jgi:DNA-binding CsgD family transcriptional regulator
VCQGRSNREIAERLVLSTKTVEFHLTNVFRKLDVSSRGELRLVLAENQGGGREIPGQTPQRPDS